MKVLKITFTAIVLAISSSPAQQMVVAIDKFENKAKAGSQLFDTLRTRITDEIINTRKFEVVERERLASVLSEQKLKAAGLTDAEGGPEEGKLKSAGYVLYGTVLSLGIDSSSAAVGGVEAAKMTAKTEIQLRIASAETGKILSSKTIVAIKSQARMESAGTATGGNMPEQVIRDSLADAAKKVTDALMDLSYPAKIMAVGKQDITVNITREQVSEGDVFEAFETGEELFDPDTKESLGAEEELVGRLSVSRPGAKTSKFIPQEGSDLGQFKPGMVVRRVDPEILKKEAAKAKAVNTQRFEKRF